MNKAQEELEKIEEKLHEKIGNLDCHCSDCINLYLEKKGILLGIEETKKEILEKLKNKRYFPRGSGDVCVAWNDIEEVLK